MTTLDLYRLAEKESIPIEEVTLLENRKSFSLALGPNYYCIALDKKQIEYSSDYKVCLAHEIGHCMTGSFYNKYSKFDLIEKHESTASRWAIKRLLPEDKLREALHRGHTEVWQMAELFDVTEDLVREAIDYYRSQQCV